MPERDRPTSADPLSAGAGGGEAPIRAAYSLGVEDYAALLNAQGLRRHLGQPPRWLWYALGLFIACAGVFWIGRSAGPWPGWLSLLHLAMAAFAFAAPTWYWAYLRHAVRRQDKAGNDFVLTLGENAIHVANGDAEGEMAYDSIRRLDERPRHLLLWLDRRTAAIVPKRAFVDDAASRAFSGRIASELRRAAPVAAGPAASRGAADGSAEDKR